MKDAVFGFPHTLAGMDVFDVPVTGETIRLGQFIKLANLVDTGGQAKEVIAAGLVTVNGRVDTRRGKVLRPGDEVAVLAVDAPTSQPQAAARVVAAGASMGPDDDDDLGEFFDEKTANDDFDPEKWRNL